MRATVGILSILGLSFTVATAAAQAPRSSAPPQRRAFLLPPEALPVSELPIVARAAAEDLSSEPAMTPVVRPAGRSVATGPGWLNGTDSNVRLASGTSGNPSQVRQLTPRTIGTKDEPSFVSKGFDKLKGAFGGNTRPDSAERAPGTLPPGVASVTATANTAFRGTTAAGTPVYAGPPAYRWYGWGSVTPGANPYAPTGQYPPASANWYSITGATPGAFPVPVANPMRPDSGTEPPAYVSVPNQRVAPGHGQSGMGMPVPGAARGADPARQAPPPVDLSRVDRPGAHRITPTPTISAPPVINPLPSAATTDREPPIRPITSLPPLPQLPEASRGEATISDPRSLPAPLPVSVTDEQANWQRKSDRIAPGEWSPVGGKPHAPASIPAPPSSPAPNWQQGSRGIETPKSTTARGQAADSRPDPMVTLIQGVCVGRTDRLDVRWTGSKKLMVRFSCSSGEAAQKLVRDISARPELTPLQIDFAITVR